MKVLLQTLILSLVFFSARAQEEAKKQFISAGLLCGDASLAPGYLFSQNISTVSIPLSAEYYIDSRISFKSDIYLHVSSGMTSDSLTLLNNHQLFTGLAYHFKTNGYFDPYIAFQPGVSYAQLHSEMKEKVTVLDVTDPSYHPNIVPVAALSLGFRYFFPRYFHIFIEARYVHGTLVSDRPTPGSFPLDELKIQFGLGWNIRTKKSS
ncbi:MAG: hypothetical protein ACHQRM_17030 [Bacteroidia bacterium]